MILEKNIDRELMVKSKQELSQGLYQTIQLISDKSFLSIDEVLEIVHAETAILNGCKLDSSLPSYINEILDEYNIDIFKHDFKIEVMKTMSTYLDGFLLNK